MIVIDPESGKITHAVNVTVDELDQLLRLRDTTMVHVTPRTILDCQGKESGGQREIGVTDGVRTVSSSHVVSGHRGRD